MRVRIPGTGASGGTAGRGRSRRRESSPLLAGRSEAEREEMLGSLGPDALEIDREAFAERISRRRGGIKSALMDASEPTSAGSAGGRHSDD